MHTTRSRICSRSLNNIFAYCIPHHRSVQGCDGQGLRRLLPLPMGTLVDMVIDLSAPLSRAPFCGRCGNVTTQDDVIKLPNGQDVQQTLVAWDLSPLCKLCGFYSSEATASVSATRKQLLTRRDNGGQLSSSTTAFSELDLSRVMAPIRFSSTACDRFSTSNQQAGTSYNTRRTRTRTF
jgi:hypothetical protein